MSSDSKHLTCRQRKKTAILVPLSRILKQCRKKTTEIHWHSSLISLHLLSKGKQSTSKICHRWTSNVYYNGRYYIAATGQLWTPKLHLNHWPSSHGHSETNKFKTYILASGFYRTHLEKSTIDMLNITTAWWWHYFDDSVYRQTIIRRRNDKHTNHHIPTHDYTCT